MRNIEEINLQFAQIKGNVLKRPAMYFGMNEQWICYVLDLLTQNAPSQKIIVRLTDNGIKIESNKTVKLIFVPDFAFLEHVQGSSIRTYDSGLNTFLFCSEQFKLGCEFEEYGFSVLSFDREGLSINKGEGSGFSIDVEFEEFFQTYINKIPYRLKENIRNWLIFHPSVKVEFYSSPDSQSELLHEPLGTDVLFEAFSRFYSLYREPFRGEAKSGNVKVKIVLGFHDTFDVDVKSYMNGQRLLFDQGEHVHTLDIAISKKLMKENLKLNGKYIALIFINIPEDEIDYNSPIRNYKPGNPLIFDLIEKIVDEQLHQIEYWGELPFIYDFERKLTTQH
jgi:hypothetical protein